MLKFRSMMENVAEKLFGRLLPQVKAQAGGCTWEFLSCCGYNNNQAYTREICDGLFTGRTACSGLCPM